jgi:hypothetical protein
VSKNSNQEKKRHDKKPEMVFWIMEIDFDIGLAHCYYFVNRGRRNYDVVRGE